MRGGISEERESVVGPRPKDRAHNYAGEVFNLSGSEIIFLLLAGLVVLGPERLPGVIRTVGKIYGDVRRAARGLEKELTETFREPLDDFKSVKKDLSLGFGQIDPEPSPPMRPEKSRPVISDPHDQPTEVDQQLPNTTEGGIAQDPD